MPDRVLNLINTGLEKGSDIFATRPESASDTCLDQELEENILVEHYSAVLDA